MKKILSIILTATMVFSLVASFRAPTAKAAGPLPVNLGSAGNFVILAKSGISTVPTSAVTGNIGVSPITATAITGFSLIMDSTNVFSTSSQVTGKVYAADYAPPTPSNMTTAVSDMETAFTDAAGRASDQTGLGDGNIGGMNLTPGVYKWSTGLLIPTNVTLTGSATDVWIFQVAQNLTMSSATNVILAGGALAKNVFWQVSGNVTVGTTAHIEGVVLCQTNIALATDASVNGKLLAQTAVTLDGNTVTDILPAPPPPPPEVPEYSISGMKFNDLDGDAVKDAGELGLQGWTIRLEQPLGTVINTKITAVDGSYSFTDLPPGTYYVSEVAQSGWTQTSPTNPNYHTVTIDNTNRIGTGKNFGNFLPAPPPPPPEVPKFTFIKEGPTEAYLGDTVTYTIHFTDIGGDTTNVIVKDYLPAQAEFVDASPVYDYNKDSRTVTWKFDEFKNGGEENLWLKVTLKGECGADAINKATLEAENLGEILESEVTTKVLCITPIPVYHQNFFSGYPDKTYKPERSISRAEVASSTGRALGLPYLELGTDVSSPTFLDVPATFWAFGNIEVAYKEKLVIGYPDGTYGPDRFITRAEVAMIFFRLLGIQPVHSSKPTFSDTDSSHWAYGAIEAIAKEGIIKGYPDGTYGPDRFITRAEYVTIACKSLFRRGPFKDGKINNPYPDVKSTHWAYEYIMEASIPHVVVNPERLDVLIVIPSKKIPLYSEGPDSTITVPELGSTIFAIVPVDGLTPTGADPAPREVTVRIIGKGGLP